jgi:copper chaperone NosL
MKYPSILSALLLLVISFAVIGCQKESDLDRLPEIIYGQDICAECSMIINEARYAASYVTMDGDVRLFDDIGGMLAHNARANEAVHIFWVHDYETEDWLNAEQATFVLDRGVNSPMGWGVIAFANTEVATAYTAEHTGVITTFAALQEEIKTGRLDPESLAEHNHID